MLVREVVARLEAAGWQEAMRSDVSRSLRGPDGTRVATLPVDADRSLSTRALEALQRHTGVTLI